MERMPGTAHVQALRTALAANGRAVRRAQQQKARDNACRAAGGLTPSKVKTVLAIYVLSQWDVPLTLEVAQRLSKLQPQQPGYPDQALLSKLFLATPVSSLEGIFQPEHPQWQGPVATAQKVLLEHRTWLWVRKQNMEHGAAPAASAIYDKLTGAADMQDGLRLETAKRSRNKRVATWRARWRVRRGRLRAAVAEDPAGLRVETFWRMAAYLMDQPGAKKTLWLNLDETTVPMNPPAPVGCIVAAEQWQSYPARPHVKVQQRTRRIAFTYCGIICSESEIQPHLPHFLLVTKKAISAKIQKAYEALPATQLKVLRRDSAWMTADCLETILRALQAALEPFLENFTPVLLLDCAMSHLTKSVMATALACNLQLLYVPCVGVHGEVRDLHRALAQLMGNPAELPAAAKPTPAALTVIWPQRRRMQYAFNLLFPP
eukprot:s2861_g7.t1